MAQHLLQLASSYVTEFIFNISFKPLFCRKVSLKWQLPKYRLYIFRGTWMFCGNVVKNELIRENRIILTALQVHKNPCWSVCVSAEAQVCIVSLLGTSRKHRAMACEVGCSTVGSVNRFVEGKHQPFHSLLSIISVFGVNGTSPAAALIATNHSFCLLAAPYVNRRCTRSPLSKLFLPNTVSTSLDFTNAAIWNRSKELDITHLCICRLLNRYSPAVFYSYISCTFPPAWNVIFCLACCSFDQGARPLKKIGFKQFPFPSNAFSVLLSTRLFVWWLALSLSQTVRHTCQQLGAKTHLWS